jgi:hypothetical protein
MLRFKSFLLAEGGNLKVGPIAAGKINVTPENRSQHIDDIHGALSAIHDHVQKHHHGVELFGPKKEGLNSRKIFTGSTADFMNKSISHKDFALHKPVVGDVDFQVAEHHKPHVEAALQPGNKFGKYTVAGVKKHGKEISAVMKHENGEHHQFDFQYVDHPGSDENRFLHSSHWGDTKMGIKGLHHKILLNAVGGEDHKFSITHGLRSRHNDEDPGTKNPAEVSKKLFGKNVGEKIRSFTGVAQAIKDHIPTDRHQEILDKFEKSLPQRGVNHAPAVAHLRHTLGMKPITESETPEKHVHATYMGVPSFPHKGHGMDIGSSMSAGNPGPKIVGLSGKSHAFSDEERVNIAHRVLGPEHQIKVEKSAGQTIGRAMDAIESNPGKKILHLHFGHDRADFANRLKDSINAGRIPELNGRKFDEVHVHLPADTNRSHGFSGTKMRTAAAEGDLDTFHKHLGDGFSRDEAKTLMDRTAKAISAGSLTVKR